MACSTHVCDVEQVFRSEHGTRRDGHQVDSGRLVDGLWLPVDEHALSALSGLPVIPVLLAHWAPLKVLDTVDLDRLLVKETHLGQLVDLDGLTNSHSSNVSVIGRPLESGPLKTWGSVDVLDWLLGGEGSEDLLSLDVPDDVRVPLVLGTEGLPESGVGRVFVVAKRLVGPGDEVVLTWRKLDEPDAWVSQSEDVDTDRSVEVGSGPKGDTDAVKRRKVGTERGPLEVEFSPFLQVSKVPMQTRLTLFLRTLPSVLLTLSETPFLPFHMISTSVSRKVRYWSRPAASPSQLRTWS